MSQDLRIFISSPGDVTPERLIAKRVIDRLAREFEHHCNIEPVLWERQPLIASGHFQESIEPPPSKTEIVVVVIWSRLGTPLPKNKFSGAVTGGEVTGTEWEFEDAVNAYEQRKLPNILTYFKRAPVMASLEDDAELERRRAQKRMVEDFVQRWFEDKEAGTFKAASHPFQTSAEFEDMLENHLRELISRHIDVTDTDEGRVRWHEGSPFRGLETFEIEHAPIFFGRTRARNELREVLVRQASRGCAFVLVFGASGSGKSSLVKAGLLPDLMLPGMVENVGLCRVALMRPSDNPEDLFAALSAALLRKTVQSQTTEAPQVTALSELFDLEYDTTTLAFQLRDASNALLPIRQGLKLARETAKLADYAEARLAIVVDQLEELFTIDYSDEDRQRFVDTLAALARSGQVWVIATMRSDFFDRLAKLPELVRLSQGEGRYLIVPPNEAEVGQIIRQPAQAAGLDFETREDGIPLYEILREVAGKDPSALPLLEFTLEQLWQQRSDKRTLTYEAYERLGGMEGALGKRAEEVFKKQPEEVQQALPKVLRALVTVGQEEHSTATARTALLDSFPQGTPQRQLVDALLDPSARLLIADEGGQVRITHEALLSHWPRTAAQIRTDRQDLQTRARVEAAFASWEQGDKDKAFLLAEGKPLAEAQDLLVRYRDELDAQTIKFIEASSVRARRKKRRLVAFAIGASVLAIVAGASAFWAFRQTYIAKEKEREATKQKQAAQEELAKNYWNNAIVAKKNNNILRSLHFFARSGKASIQSSELENSIFGIQNDLNLFLACTIYSGKTQGAILSRDERIILTWGGDSIRLWHTKDGTQAAQLMSHEKSVRGAVFSKDESLILTWGGDGSARLWLSKDGTAAVAPMEHEKSVNGAVFSRDESLILTWSSDGTARLWHADDGIAAAQPMKHDGWVNGAVFNKDERLILTWSDDGNARLWHAKDGTAAAQPMMHEKSVSGAVFSNDERLILTWSDDGTARLWHAEDGTAAARLMVHEKSVSGAVFSQDERLILTWGGNTARLWHAKDGTAAAQPMKHEEKVKGAVFSKDESLILTWSSDGTARLWHAEDGTAAAQPMKHEGWVNGAVFSKDEKLILTWSSDGTARLWHAEDGAAAAQPMKHEGWVNGAVFSKDEKLILTRSGDGTARLWHANGGATAAQPMMHEKSVHGALFNKNEKLILTWGGKTVRLWHSKDHAAAAQPMKHEKHVRGAVFSKDEKLILTWSNDGTARLWHAKDGTTAAQPMKHENMVNGAIFSKDERLILTWSSDGTARLWHVKDGTRTVAPMKHENSVNGAVFSKNERLILTWSDDGTARLWHAEDGTAAAQPMKHEEKVNGAVFSKDEKLILTWSSDGTARLWYAKDGTGAVAPMKHEESVRRAVFNKDERLILTWSDDGTARLWRTKDGTAAAQLMKHESRINGAMFSQDERLILTWSKDGTTRLWHAKDGTIAAAPMKHEGLVNGAVFNKDEKLILTWSDDGTARLWRTKDGTAAAQLMKHESRINGAMFSQDERLILTWSKDDTARLWLTKDGSPTAAPMKHEKNVYGAVFSDYDRLILTWSRDNTARLWYAKDGSAAAAPMKHEQTVSNAVFNKDVSLILTWNGSEAQVRDIGVDYEFPRQYLPLFVEVSTGTEMDKAGNVTMLSARDWSKRKDKYIEIAEKHLETCQFKENNYYLRQKRYWESGK